MTEEPHRGDVSAQVEPSSDAAGPLPEPELSQLAVRQRELELERASLELRREEEALRDELERAAFRRKHPYQSMVADILRPKSWAQAATLMAALSPVVIGAVGFVNDQRARQTSEREAQQAMDAAEHAAQREREDKLLLLAIDATSSPQRRVSVFRYIQATSSSAAMKTWAAQEAESIVSVVTHETVLADAAAEASKRAKDEVVASIEDPESAGEGEGEGESETEAARDRYAEVVEVYEQRRAQEAEFAVAAAAKQREAEQLELGLEVDPREVPALALERVRDPKRCLVVFLPPREAKRATTLAIAERVRACKRAMTLATWSPESVPGHTLIWDAFAGRERIACQCNLADEDG